MVVMAAGLVVKDHDERIFPCRAHLDLAHEIRDEHLPLRDVRITRVFVIVTDRLDPRNGRKRVALEIGQEVRIIDDVRRAHLARRVVREVEI